MYKEYLEQKIPFIHYEYTNYSGNLRGQGCFRLDTVTNTKFLDDATGSFVNSTMTFNKVQLKKLLKSFKHKAVKITAYLPETFEKREEFKAILERYDVLFI